MEFFSFTFDETFMMFSQEAMRKKYLEWKNMTFFRFLRNLSPEIFFFFKFLLKLAS